MNEKTLSHLMQKHEGEELEKILKEDMVLRMRAKALQMEEMSAKKEHHIRMKAIQEKWRELKSECPHLETTYYPDASGNNDSETTCNICGASL